MLSCTHYGEPSCSCTLEPTWASTPVNPLVGTNRSFSLSSWKVSLCIHHNNPYKQQMLQHNQLQKVHLCPSSHRSLTNCFSWFALCAVRIKCLMNMVKNLVFSLIDCGCSPIFRKCSQVFNRYSIRCCINSCFSPCRKKVLLLTLIPIKLWAQHSW